MSKQDTKYWEQWQPRTSVFGLQHLFLKNKDYIQQYDAVSWPIWALSCRCSHFTGQPATGSPQTMFSDWLVDKVALDLNTPNSCKWSTGTLCSAPQCSCEQTSCAFQGLRRGVWQAVGVCFWHRFQGLAEHVQPLQNPPGERESSFLFSCVSACCNLTRAKLLGSTISVTVIQLSTGPLLGIIPAWFNSVVRTTTECCFISAVDTLLADGFTNVTVKISWICPWRPPRRCRWGPWESAAATLKLAFRHAPAGMYGPHR